MTPMIQQRRVKLSKIDRVPNNLTLLKLLMLLMILQKEVVSSLVAKVVAKDSRP